MEMYVIKCKKHGWALILSSIQILKLKYYEDTFLKKGSKYRNLFYISGKLNGTHLMHKGKIGKER